MESHRIAEIPPGEMPDPHAGLTIAEMKAADNYQDHRIENVERGDDFTSITTDDGTGLGWSRERVGDERYDGVVPKLGSAIRIYSPSGFGSSFHGIDVDAQELFWKTPMERDADRAAWLADYDRRNRERFAEQKASLDLDYEMLPDPLKARIDRFREADPSFRVDSEGYEMFCCTEAAKFYRRAKEAGDKRERPDAVDAFFASPDRAKGDKVWDVELPDDPALAWLLYAWAVGDEPGGYDHKTQRAMLDHTDQHSGNTFGGAMSLAAALLRGDDV